MGKLKKFLMFPGQIWHQKIALKIIKKTFKQCDSSVFIGHNFTVAGAGNITIGIKTSIGPNCTFYATKAPLTIGSYVMIAPGVTIVTGEHRIDVIGRYMRDITEAEKLPENDRPVVIEDDVWIGSNVTIMKGVTIGRGSVIHAGAVLTRSVKPYTVYISDKLKVARFSEEEIVEHESLLKAETGD